MPRIELEIDRSSIVRIGRSGLQPHWVSESNCKWGRGRSLEPLLHRLERGKSVQEIAAFLDRELTEHFGASSPSSSLSFATKLEAWFSQHWPNRS